MVLALLYTVGDADDSIESEDGRMIKLAFRKSNCTLVLT